jgi:hypothetical protein
MASRLYPRDTPCTTCGQAVTVIEAEQPDFGAVQQPPIISYRHAEFPDMGGVDDRCGRMPVSG